MDVPAVAVTLNTNDFGDLRTMATLAQISPAKIDMEDTADDSNGNLVVVSGTGLTETTTFLHGVCLADFAITCGNLPGVSLWAPVQSECSLGTIDNDIDQTLWMDEVFVNSVEFSYTTGANATENYGAETDNKMWLLNDAAYVTWDTFVITSTEVGADLVLLSLKDSGTIGNLSTGNLAFLRKDSNGYPAVTFYDLSENESTNVRVVTGDSAVTTNFAYSHTNTNTLYFPDGNSYVAGDIIYAVYASSEYGDLAVGGVATTGDWSAEDYMELLDDTMRPDHVGAIRQGQVEIYLVSDTDASWDQAWRLTGCTISADLTREPLAELGHLSPYDRPLTMPIPITVTIDSTAGDLENWAKVSNQTFDTDLDDIDLADLMAYEDLKLVVKIYAQTDEEAGGTGAARTVYTGSPLVGQYPYMDGTKGTVYSATNTERALKTIVVEHLKITDEGASLDMGSNMTQTFGFRSTNDLYVVKGDISVSRVTDTHKIRRNA